MLELTFREAQRMGHNYIGTEHILLALAEFENGTGVLMNDDNGDPGSNLSRINGPLATSIAAGDYRHAGGVAKSENADHLRLVLG